MSGYPMTPAPRRRATLTRRLLAWALGAIFLVWGCFVAVAFHTGVHEADELTDGHLASTAALLLNLQTTRFVEPDRATERVPIPALKSHDYQQSLSVAVWNAHGELLTRSGEAPEPAFDGHEGFADLQLGEPRLPWRSFSQWNAAHDRLVMVLLRLEERDDLASDIAGQMVEPGLWLLPVVGLALGLAIQRGMRPLYALSNDVARLDVASAERLPARHALREFDSVVASINTLIGQQQAALQRERELASEVAHELRTPLSSIALQAQALRGDMPAAEREQALQRIGGDALKAGHVLDQLLALARASRAELAEAAVPLDLAVLARRVAGDFAQSAWQRQGELAVSGLEALPLRGHPVLLELALRNLVENALRHTPAGTSVELQLGRAGGESWLQVCDNGARLNGGASRPAAAESLGLGLKIVGRVAEVHGARFGPIPAPAPFTTCYRLAWPVGAAEAAAKIA